MFDFVKVEVQKLKLNYFLKGCPKMETKLLFIRLLKRGSYSENSGNDDMQMVYELWKTHIQVKNNSMHKLNLLEFSSSSESNTSSRWKGKKRKEFRTFSPNTHASNSFVVVFLLLLLHCKDVKNPQTKRKEKQTIEKKKFFLYYHVLLIVICMWACVCALPR